MIKSLMCIFVSVFHIVLRADPYYSVEKNWLPQNCLENLIDVVEQFIEENYTEANLKKHIAYISDQQPNRSSYAFSVYTSGTKSNHELPGIRFEKLPRVLQVIQKKMEKEMKIKRGRLLFNVQRYKNASQFLPTHFDGEFFLFVKNTDDTITIQKALRPKKTAVLTLINDASEGGTRLFLPNQEESFVVKNYATDLLLFRNDKVLHGANSFYLLPGLNEHYSGYIRYTIGWRSLDDQCVLYEEGKEAEEVSYERAIKLHKEYLENEWPIRYKEIKKAAF